MKKHVYEQTPPILLVFEFLTEAGPSERLKRHMQQTDLLQPLGP